MDSDMSGFISLCSALGKVKEIILADCGLGPDSVAELSKVFTCADAALTKIDVGNNELDPDSLKALKAAASEECEVLCD